LRCFFANLGVRRANIGNILPTNNDEWRKNSQNLAFFSLCRHALSQDKRVLAFSFVLYRLFRVLGHKIFPTGTVWVLLTCRDGNLPSVCWVQIVCCGRVNPAPTWFWLYQLNGRSRAVATTGTVRP